MFGLALVAREFILITVGEKWLGCVLLLQMLSVGGAFLPLYAVYQNQIVSKGRSDLYLWCSAVQVLLQVLIVLLLASKGITVMVGAYAALNILYLLVWHVQMQKALRVSLLAVATDILPFCLAALLTMGLTWLLTMWTENPWLLFLVRVPMAVLFYVALMRVMGAEILNECLRFAKKKL